MDFAVITAWRHLRATRGGPVSVITAVAVVGIALGVAALSGVLAVTSGFEAAFREKILGINAHFVLTGGAEFRDHREVAERVRATPGVVGATPFVANPMMITHGDRIAGVMVKGVDPDTLGQVLDLPSYLLADAPDAIRALRPADARPPTLAAPARAAGSFDSLEDYLRSAAVAVSPAAARPTSPDAPTSDAHANDTLALPPEPEPEPTPSPSSPSPTPTPAPSSPPPLPTGATPAFAPPPPVESDDDDPSIALAAEVRAEAATAARERAADLPGVILGHALAAALDAHVGDVVHVVSPLAGSDQIVVRHGPAPVVRDFRVVGRFDAGFDEYGSRLAYIDLWQAQQLFEQGDVVNGLEVRVREVDQAARVARRVERALGGRPYQALEWQAVHRNLFTALRLQKLALAIVITLIVLVAAFNVVATLVMAVLDKRREIAVLKAMGADAASVMRIFLLQGLAVGSAGTLLGLALGGGICGALSRWHFPLDARVYLIRFVPVRASVLEFALTAAIAMAISLAASLVPAAWAARLSPVDGLRGD